MHCDSNSKPLSKSTKGSNIDHLADTFNILLVVNLKTGVRRSSYCLLLGNKVDPAHSEMPSNQIMLSQQIELRAAEEAGKVLHLEYGLREFETRSHRQRRRNMRDLVC